jgi:hypothetical protein
VVRRIAGRKYGGNLRCVVNVDKRTGVERQKAGLSRSEAPQILIEPA